MTEKEHCNKRLAVRLGDDGIRNESTNRKLAQTYGSLLRDTKIRCNGAAGTANDGQNIVIEKSDIIVIIIVIKNRYRYHVTL